MPKEIVDDASALCSNALKVFLSRAADDLDTLGDKDSMDYLADEIGRRIFKLMMKPEEDMEIGMSLGCLCMDGLMAIELRRWWRQALGLNISVLDIMGSGTLVELGKVGV